MRVVVQRVIKAQVVIDKEETRSIGKGLVVLLGIEMIDNSNDVEWLVNKIINLRIFNDIEGIMNHSLLDTEGHLMVVSQFTLMASTKKGNRPSYIRAAKHDHAVPLYELFLERIHNQPGIKLVSGTFGKDMQIESVNDGPVTIQIDSKNRE